MLLDNRQALFPVWKRTTDMKSTVRFSRSANESKTLGQRQTHQHSLSISELGKNLGASRLPCQLNFFYDKIARNELPIHSKTPLRKGDCCLKPFLLPGVE